MMGCMYCEEIVKGKQDCHAQQEFNEVILGTIRIQLSTNGPSIESNARTEV